MIVLSVFQHMATLPGHEGSFKKPKNAFLNDPEPKKSFLAIFLSLVCWIDLMLHIVIVLNVFQPSAMLSGHVESFKDHKNVFLNDPKSQKKVFGHFLDLDNVFQHWATLPDHVGGPVGMNEVGMGVVGMGALGETSKSQTRRINQTSNKIKCGPCRLLIGQVYLNSQSFSLNLCTRGRSGPSRSLIGQVYLTSKIFSLKLCIRGRSGPSRSLIGQVYLGLLDRLDAPYCDSTECFPT